MKRSVYLLISYFLVISPTILAQSNNSRLVCDNSNFCTRNDSPSSHLLYQLTARDTPFHRYQQWHHHGEPFDIAFSTVALNQQSKRRATGNTVFVFDPRRTVWYAYDRNGSLIGSGAASGGRHYCPDIGRSCRTPVGTFKVHRKGSVYCRSSKYPLGRGGAPMPYCMFFHRGYAIHGSPDVPNYNASHGCIRVKPQMARYLHRDVISIGTTVIVRPY